MSEPVCPFSTDHPSIVLEIVNQRICPRQLADCAQKKILDDVLEIFWVDDSIDGAAGNLGEPRTHPETEDRSNMHNRLSGFCTEVGAGSHRPY